MPLPTSKVHPLDDEHELVVVDDTRAWVTDRRGKRVSITWTRHPQESASAFLTRATEHGHRVLAYISPGN
jgi:hypothetical protein